MAEVNTNQNTNTGDSNNNQVQNNTQQNTNQNNQAQQNNTAQNTQQVQQNNAVQNTQQVEQKDTLKEFMEKNGIEDSEALSKFWADHKKAEDAKKDDLTKANDTITSLTKKLNEAVNRAVIAEAKISAMKLGARPELVDDLVIVAKSRATGDKTVETVISEIKGSDSGKFYFVDESEQNNGTGNVTNRKPGQVTNNQQNQNRTNANSNAQNNSNQNSGDKYAGTIAERLFKNRKQTVAKSSYFKN